MQTLTVDKSDLITVTDFAKSKSVSRQTVYNWIALKKIKVEVIAGATFVKLSSTVNI